ncbi:MAG TPA: ABC transporter ATP-binding protein, partial [Holophagaceae bacterium]|nr:ABC transporter ATP-binding protein [Holophagaceae bacterium]
MAHLELLGIGKAFGGRPVLSEVSFAAEAGAFVVLVGPSGCGKSTLLRILAGLEAADAGEIRLGGERLDRIEAGRRDLAMVFQDYALYPHMTVAENLAFPLKVRRAPRAEREARVAETAAMLGLGEVLDRRPAQLSGGQRQRVAIGRALVRRPSLFLFDEPLSNLDAQLRAQMRVELAALHRSLGTTTVHVTHDQAEAMTLADRLVVLNQGRIQQAGPPLELYRDPANRFVGAFLGQPGMAFLEGRLIRDPVPAFLSGGLRLEGLGPGLPEGPAALGLRPEALSLVPAGEGDLPGQVALVEALGPACHVFVDTGAARLVALADAAPGLAPGD